MSQPTQTPNSKNSPSRNLVPARNDQQGNIQPSDPEMRYTTTVRIQTTISSSSPLAEDDLLSEVSQDLNEIIASTDHQAGNYLLSGNQQMAVRKRSTKSSRSRVRNSIMIQVEEQKERPREIQIEEPRRSYHESPPAKSPLFGNSARRSVHKERTEGASPISRASNNRTAPQTFEQVPVERREQERHSPIKQISPDKVLNSQQSEIFSKQESQAVGSVHLQPAEQRTDYSFSKIKSDMASKPKFEIDIQSQTQQEMPNTISQASIGGPKKISVGDNPEKEQIKQVSSKNLLLNMEKQAEEFRLLQQHYMQSFRSAISQPIHQGTASQVSVQGGQTEVELTQPRQSHFTSLTPQKVQVKTPERYNQTPAFHKGEEQLQKAAEEIQKSQIKANTLNEQWNNRLQNLGKPAGFIKPKEVGLVEVTDAVLYGQKPAGVSMRDVLLNKNKLIEYLKAQIRSKIEGTWITEHRERVKEFKKDSYIQSGNRLKERIDTKKQLAEEIERVKRQTQLLKSENKSTYGEIVAETAKIDKEHEMVCKFLHIKSFSLWMQGFPKHIEDQSGLQCYTEFNLDNKMLGRFRIRQRESTIQFSVFPMFTAADKDGLFFRLSKRATALKTSLALKFSEKPLLPLEVLLFVSNQYRLYEQLQQQLKYMRLVMNVESVQIDESVEFLTLHMMMGEEKAEIQIDLVQYNWNNYIKVKWGSQSQRVRKIGEKARGKYNNRLTYIADKLQALASSKTSN